MKITLTYDGIDPDIDRHADHMASLHHLELVGAGYDGQERDLQYSGRWWDCLVFAFTMSGKYGVHFS